MNLNKAIANGGITRVLSPLRNFSQDDYKFAVIGEDGQISKISYSHDPKRKFCT